MFKVTKEFIKARQPYAGRWIIKQITNVQRLGGGIQNDCYKNASNYMEKERANGKDVNYVSGWLVLPYNKITDSTFILQHWWNIDRYGNYFDTSPLTDASEEYVIDLALYEYCSKQSLKTNVAHSLLYKNSKFEIILNPQTMDMQEIDKLTTDNLYLLKNN